MNEVERAPDDGPPPAADPDPFADPVADAGATPEATGYVRVPDGVLLQHVSDETVLLHLESGTYFGLDPIGTRMLDLALELAEAEAVVDALESEYDAERERLHHDLDHLLRDLADKGLIVRSNTA